MSSHGNGAPGASGTGPDLGYILNLFWFINLFIFIGENNMNTSTYFVHTLSLFYVMKLLVIFEIKIYQKLPSFLTIQKPEHVNRLSVSSFAATVKPPPFDGSNYKRWHERLILWLTTLRMMHVKEDKPEKSLQRKGVRSMRLIPSFEAWSLLFSVKTW